MAEGRTLLISAVADYCGFCIKTRAGAFTNLPFRGKVVSTQVGCGRRSRQRSRELASLLSEGNERSYYERLHQKWLGSSTIRWTMNRRPGSTPWYFRLSRIRQGEDGAGHRDATQHVFAQRHQRRGDLGGDRARDQHRPAERPAQPLQPAELTAGPMAVKSSRSTAPILPHRISPRCSAAPKGSGRMRITSEGKQPYYITARNGSILSFAGLWDEWRDRVNNETVNSCTILVTDANSFTRAIHDRMPAILEREKVGPWLSGEAGTELLKPAPEDALRMWPVSKRVSKPGNTDDATFIEPVELQSTEREPQGKLLH
jgi:hypothetical protein